MGSSHFMRLSLKKGAFAALSRAAYRKFGASRSFFARCGMPRVFLQDFPGRKNSWSRAVVFHISRKTSEMWGTHRGWQGQIFDRNLDGGYRNQCQIIHQADFLLHEGLGIANAAQ